MSRELKKHIDEIKNPVKVFSVTRQSLTVGESKRLDSGTSLIIELFADQWPALVTMRESDPGTYKKYQPNFIRKCVFGVDLFPLTLPIGYVLACFFLSCRVPGYKLEAVSLLLAEWLNESGNRDKLYEGWDHAKMVNTKAVDPTTVPAKWDGMDGMGAAEAMYGEPPQKDLF